MFRGTPIGMDRVNFAGKYRHHPMAKSTMANDRRLWLEDRVSGEAMRVEESGVDRASRRLTTWDDTPKLTTLGAERGAVAYFLAAQLGVALIAPSSGVAVFWPASGHAVAILIISGRRAYPASLIRFAVATAAANLLSARILLTATFKGIKGA